MNYQYKIDSTLLQNHIYLINIFARPALFISNSPMDTNYNKLFLYAANSPLQNKYIKPKLSREESLKNLINLLQNKEDSVPTATIQQYTKIESHLNKQQHRKLSKQKLIIKQKVEDKQKNRLFLPKVIPVVQDMSQEELDRTKQEYVRARIEKYIDQYVKKIEDDHLLDQYEDHSTLIQQAVADIRKKVIQQIYNEKNRQNQSYITKPKHKFIKFPGSSKDTLEPIHYTRPFEHKSASKTIPQNASIMIKHHKKSLSTIEQIYSSPKVQRSLIKEKSKEKLHEIDSLKKRLHKDSILKNSFSDIEQKNRMTAHLNLYKLDLDRINKNMEIREKERRRSQRHFAKKIERQSYYS